jgi:hypothetical protein
MTPPDCRKFLIVVLVGCFLMPQAVSAFSLKTLPRQNLTPESLEQAGRGDYFLQGSGYSSSIGPISTRRAILYSLLLPGLGDQYLGRSGRATFFFTTEAAIWTSFIVFEVQGYLREDGYKEYAVAYGGISSTSHSDEYYRIISQHNSSDEYEEYIKQDGRFELYPDDNYDNLERYYLTEQVADFEPWLWPSDEKRREYRDIRQGSRLARRRALYSVAAAVTNRLVSSLLTFKTARDMNSNETVSSRSRYSIEFGFPAVRSSEPLLTGVVFVRTF